MTMIVSNILHGRDVVSSTIPYIIHKEIRKYPGDI